MWSVTPTKAWLAKQLPPVPGDRRRWRR
ncbi:hypothetical protein ACWGLP_28970 [Streptomyces lydicus]